MELTRENFYKLSKQQRRKLNRYINFLLWLQRVPVLHDLIRRLGDLVFYKL